MPSANEVRGSHPSIRFAFDESPKYEPMSIASRSGGHGDVLDPARAGRRPRSPRRSRAATRCSSLPTLNIFAGASGRERREQQALDDVVDVEAVALLRPSPNTVIVSPASARRMKIGRNPWKSSRRRWRGPNTLVSRTAHGAQPVHLVVEEVQLLGRVLRDPVDVDRGDRVVLVDRQVARLAEDLAGRREHDDARRRSRGGAGRGTRTGWRCSTRGRTAGRPSSRRGSPDPARLKTTSARRGRVTHVGTVDLDDIAPRPRRSPARPRCGRRARGSRDSRRGGARARRPP